MYTTLATLKEVKACIPGYTRMISFFTTQADMKDVKIPLFMIPLVGETDDCTWALSNGCFFDDAAYKKFYDFNLPWVIRARVNSALNNLDDAKYGRLGSDEPVPAQKALLEFFTLTTDLQVVAWFNRYRSMRIENWLWTHVFHHETFSDQFHFTAFVLTNLSDTFDQFYRRAMLRAYWAQYAPVSYSSSSGTSMRRRRYGRDDDEEDNDDEDDELDNEVRNSRRSPAARARNDAEATTVDLNVVLTQEERDARYEWISAAMSSKIDKLFRACGFSEHVYPLYQRRAGQNQMMALALTGGEDPYQKAVEFMAEHNLPERARVKGFMLSQANEKEPPGYHLTLNLSDPKMIFHAFHMLKASSLDVTTLFGVNTQSEAVENAMQNAGVRSNSAQLDQLEVQSSTADRLQLRRVERAV